VAKVDESPHTKAPMSRAEAIGWGVAFIVSLCGLATLLTTAFSMVSAGRGSETYRTWWMVESDWNNVLVLFAFSVIAVLVGAGYRLWQLRRERLEIRALEEKYGVREDAK